MELLPVNHSAYWWFKTNGTSNTAQECATLTQITILRHLKIVACRSIAEVIELFGHVGAVEQPEMQLRAVGPLVVVHSELLSEFLTE